MLPRPRQSLYEDIREYIVAEEDGELIAVGALRILWKDLAEIRSLVVQSNHTRQNIGRKIVSLLEEEARALGLPRVFALTYQEAFFCNAVTIQSPTRNCPKRYGGIVLIAKISRLRRSGSIKKPINHRNRRAEELK